MWEDIKREAKCEDKYCKYYILFYTVYEIVFKESIGSLY